MAHQMQGEKGVRNAASVPWSWVLDIVINETKLV